MRDLSALAFLLVLTGAAVWQGVDLAAMPYEDAAMLLRYSEHVAAGLGIVWNPGERPVDGATGFLFMLMTAALHACGVGSAAAARILGIAAHLGTVAAMYLAISRLTPAPAWFAGNAALWLGLGTGIAYIAAGFGTTVFPLAACLTAIQAFGIERHGETWPRAAGLPRWRCSRG